MTCPVAVRTTPATAATAPTAPTAPTASTVRLPLTSSPPMTPTTRPMAPPPVPQRMRVWRTGSLGPLCSLADPAHATTEPAVQRGDADPDDARDLALGGTLGEHLAGLPLLRRREDGLPATDSAAPARGVEPGPGAFPMRSRSNSASEAKM